IFPYCLKIVEKLLIFLLLEIFSCLAFKLTPQSLIFTKRLCTNFGNLLAICGTKKVPAVYVIDISFFRRVWIIPDPIFKIFVCHVQIAIDYRDNHRPWLCLNTIQETVSLLRRHTKVSGFLLIKMMPFGGNFFTLGGILS